MVTSFVEDSLRRYLILQRSEEVRTNRLKWEAISGAIEERSAYEQALVELREELGLVKNDVEYRGRSIPFDPKFEEHGVRVKKIYPLLFSVKSSDEIRLGWEHTGNTAWIKGQQDLEGFDTVPMLREVLEALLYQLIEPEIDRGISYIRNDRVHGASELGRKALETLKMAAQSSRARSREEFMHYMKFIGCELVAARPSMAPIFNSVSILFYDLRGYEGTSWREFTVERAGELLVYSVGAQGKAAENASTLIECGDTVITCSYSSTIAEAFRIAAERGKTFKVMVAESMFGGRAYGRALAEKLRQFGVSVQVISDQSISDCAQIADKAIVGADSILSDGSVVNGVPTLSVAEAVRNTKPFYVVCETLKFNALPSSLRLGLEEGFERVGAELVAAVATEKGMLTLEEVITCIRDMEKYAEVLQ